MTEDVDNDGDSPSDKRKLSRRAALGVAALAAGGASAAWRGWEREEPPPTHADPTEEATHPSAGASMPSSPSDTIAFVGEDGFEISHGTVRVSAPAGVAPPGTRVKVSTPNEPLPPEINAISSVVGQPVSIVLGDEEQPEHPISIAFELRGTELAATISETMQPIVMSWSDAPDSLTVTTGDWDAQSETFTVTTDHLTNFLDGVFDVGRYIWDTIQSFLGINYSKPDCAFDPLTIGATPYSISHTGDDPIWPCLTADSNGNLSVVLHSNSNMAWAVASRPSVSGSVSGDWKDLGPGLAAIYQGLFNILGKDRAAVMPGGSVRLPFAASNREIRVEIQQSPVLYGVATTLQAAVSVLDALPTGRVAEAVLESFDAFDCITEEINTFYQEESSAIARSVVVTTLSCVKAMIEEDGSRFNFAVRTALAGISMLSVAANSLIGAIQGVFREFTGNATGVYTIAADVEETPTSAPTAGGPRGPSLDEPIVVRWRFQNSGPVFGFPAIADGTVLLGKEDGYLYALDIATGRERWRAEIPSHYPGKPVIANGLVYISALMDWGGLLQAFDMHSGTRRWSFGGDKKYVSNPVVEHDVIYASANHIFYALDAATGSELWQAPYSIVSPRAAANGVVYGIDYTAQRYRFLVAFDTHTRSRRWMTSTRDDVSTLTVNDDTVYVGSWAGDFHAIDVETGTRLWSVEVGEGLKSNACIAGGMVFVDGLAKFIALDANTGAEQWNFSSESDFVFSAQAVADDVIYVGSLDRLYALDISTGEEIWRFETGNVTGGPGISVGEGVICAVYDSTHLVALGNPPTQSPEGEPERVYTPE